MSVLVPERARGEAAEGARMGPPYAASPRPVTKGSETSKPAQARAGRVSELVAGQAEGETPGVQQCVLRRERVELDPADVAVCPLDRVALEECGAAGDLH